MPELTAKEYAELKFFVNTVMGWGVGGPYGDGEDITEPKNLAIMKRVQKKINKTIMITLD